MSNSAGRKWAARLMETSPPPPALRFSMAWESTATEPTRATSISLSTTSLVAARCSRGLSLRFLEIQSAEFRESIHRFRRLHRTDEGKDHATKLDLLKRFFVFFNRCNLRNLRIVGCL